ncbi:hypothetical protein [Pseudoflavitalea rhizosphaerae]|nr:hypothetical protein [Pseudoflavitalea rhizosphaerae]
MNRMVEQTVMPSGYLFHSLRSTPTALNRQLTGNYQAITRQLSTN